MRSEWLDQTLGKMPEAFSFQVDQTLRDLKEEQTMKRFTLRTALVTMLIIALLASIAYAVISQGMEWYYHNRFTAYQQHEPEKHEAIMSHVQAVKEQKVQEDPLVNVEVREAAWVPEHQMLVISLAASARDYETAELHPEWNLDADGSYVGKEQLSEYTDDPEARGDHWLWTGKGFGPVKEMMADSEKQLLLFNADDVYLGAAEDELSMMGNMSSVDFYVSDTGEVITMLEARLDWLSPGYDQEQLEWSKDTPELSDMIQERIAKAQKMRGLVAQQNGLLKVSIPYTVTPYSDDDQQMQNERYMNYVTFEIGIE